MSAAAARLSGDTSTGRAEGLLLAALLFLVPFEPREPALALPGARITWLEGAAAVCLALLLLRLRSRAWDTLRRPPLPVVFLLGYAAAHVVSALAAPADRALGLKFALRMTAMAAVGLVVASVPVAARARALAGLAGGATVVALLAVGEGLGFREIDPFLALFRESPINVGGVRRATAGSEYPNLAGAAIAYGALAGAALGTLRGTWVLVPWAGLLAWGLLETGSRGALLAAAAGLGVVCVLLLRRAPRAARIPAAILGVLLLAAGLGLAAGTTSRLRWESEGTERWYVATYLPEETTLRLGASESRTTAVRVTNTGERSWTRREAFHLSYHWFDAQRGPLGDGGRTPLPRDLDPGESIRLEAEVRPPGPPGRYYLVWDMVQERTTWFSEQGVEPAVVEVLVGGAAPGARPPDAWAGLARAAWQPGRRELWRLALELWWERRLLGHGPDSYRRLYEARAGRVPSDMRVYANNLLLEAAATTGLVGALALAGTLLATLASAHRAWQAAVPGTLEGAVATAVLGLGVALTVHGAVDYVLAFTGHYVAFGFAVGAAGGGRRFGDVTS